MKLSTNTLAAIIAFSLSATFTAFAQNGMSLDQRNLNLHSGSKPLLDFAQIPGEGGKLAGTISMLDSNQVAYFDANGKMVSGKGRFEYKAKVPEGLYMDCEFEYDGQKAHGGIRIADLIVDYRFDGDGPKALQYVFVHSVKAAGDKFEFAYQDKTTMEVKSGPLTTFTNLDCSGGHISLTLAEIRGFGANKSFNINLFQPLQGKLELADQRSKQQ
jgi:hypothetical protein